MKKIKQIISLILAVVLCAALASCTAGYDVEVKSNGDCSVVMKVTASETDLNKLKTTSALASGLAGLSGGDITSITDTSDIETVIKEFKDQSDKAGLTETIDGVKYYSMTQDEDVKNVDEASQFFGNSGKLTTKEFWAYADKEGISESLELTKEYKKLGFEFAMVISIKMPYKIDKTNGTKTDDYTVQFDITKGNVFYLTTVASTAAWTKSADIRKAVIELAKKSNTPKKVTGVKVNYKSATSLKINWNELYSSATEYRIYRKIDKGSYKLIKTVKADAVKYDANYTPYIIDSGVKANKKYSYKVRACYKTSDFTVYGAYSNTVSKTIADLKTKPSISVKALNNKAKVTVKRKAKNVTGYEIKYSKSSKFKGAKTVTTKSTTKTLTKLSDGKKYYVKVRKYCTAADGKKVYSPYSKTVSVKVK